VGPGAGLDGCGKSRLRRVFLPGPLSAERVAIPTELSGLFEKNKLIELL